MPKSDADIMHELIVGLEGPAFEAGVIAEIERQKGRPLTEMERRHFMAKIRNDISIEGSSPEASN